LRTLIGIPALAIAVVFGVSAQAEARTLRGAVVKVVDGDSVRVKVGERTRTFHLAGVDAPELRGDAASACYGKQARKRLSRLLGRRTVRVRIVRGRNAELLRGRKNVNRAMVAGGHARAKAGGKRRGALLRKAEARARARNRGLHGSCLPTGGDPPVANVPTPGSPAPGDQTGQEAIAELTSSLTGMAFRRSTSSGDATTNYQLHLCPGGAFRYWTQESYSSGGTSFNVRSESLGQPWRVTEALVKADGSRAARVQGTVTSQASDSGPEPVSEPEAIVRVDLSGGQWHIDGEPVLAFPGAASCAPLLSHG